MPHEQLIQKEYTKRVPYIAEDNSLQYREEVVRLPAVEDVDPSPQVSASDQTVFWFVIFVMVLWNLWVSWWLHDTAKSLRILWDEYCDYINRRHFEVRSAFIEKEPPGERP